MAVQPPDPSKTADLGNGWRWLPTAHEVVFAFVCVFLLFGFHNFEKDLPAILIPTQRVTKTIIVGVMLLWCIALIRRRSPRHWWWL